MDFKHFSHAHSLVFHQVQHGSQVQCSGCKTPATGNVYACWQCSYFLHEHCYCATRSLRNPTHPLHPLTLMPYPTYHSNTFICNSCHISGNGFSYGCAACDFDLHIHCANSNNLYPAPHTPQSNVGITNPIYPPIQTNPFPNYNPPHNPTSIPNDIPSFSQPQGATPYPPIQSNPFPTYPNPNPTIPNGSPSYPPAQSTPQNPVYPPAQSSPLPGYPQPNPPPTQPSPLPGYPQPNPPATQPSPLPGYPQPSQPQPSFNPPVTTMPTTNPPTPPPPAMPIYTPPLTTITVTPPQPPPQTYNPPVTTNPPPPSASQPTPNTSQPKPSSLIKHFSHPHVLQPMELEKKNAKVCSACECELSGSAYCCTEANCTFNLHKACFDSPVEVRHKCHLDHPLTLLTAPPYKDGFTCNACLKDGKAFAYHCATCSYDLHIDCITWPETVTRQDHKHPLSLYYSSPAAANSNQEVVFMCDVCKNPVHEMAWVYYCRECDYGTHLECVASGMQPNVTVGGQTDEELLRETELKFAVLQLLLNGGLTVVPGK